MKKICEYCGNEFNAKRSINRFCNTTCSAFWRNLNFKKPSSCFKKGVKTWNTGLRKSGMSGRTHSIDTKIKMRNSALGELSSLWRGGVSSENELARKSLEYREWRKSVFDRDDYTCQECGTKSCKGNRVILNADHIKSFALYKKDRYDISNGRTLCVSCHRKIETYGQSRENQKKILHRQKGG